MYQQLSETYLFTVYEPQMTFGAKVLKNLWMSYDCAVHVTTQPPKHPTTQPPNHPYCVTNIYPEHIPCARPQLRNIKSRSATRLQIQDGFVLGFGLGLASGFGVWSLVSDSRRVVRARPPVRPTSGRVGEWGVVLWKGMCDIFGDGITITTRKTLTL